VCVLAVVIPGSQRASRFLPDSTRIGEHLDPVCRVPMKAGDVLLFLGQHFVIFWGFAIENVEFTPGFCICNTTFLN
jgi:hypothetical protein